MLVLSMLQMAPVVRSFAFVAGLGACLAAGFSNRKTVQGSLPAQAPPSEAELALEKSFREQGLELSLRQGFVAFPAVVQVREDFLEYILVGPAGAGHESIFMTQVKGSLIAAALLSLGAQAGENASWTPKDPRPSEEELAAGVSPFDVTLPSGTPLYLYAAWRSGDELYCYRIEDLVRDLSTGRSMTRHAFAFLGSKFIPGGKDKGEVLAADVYQNLINVCFFRAGDTLLTAAVPQCVFQDIWTANAWLLPPAGQAVTFVVSRERQLQLPADWKVSIPDSQPVK